jgi:hypothetical protein
MGYTHLWEYAPETPQFREHWPQILADAQLIVAHAAAVNITLAGGDGSGAAKLDLTDGIILNGDRASHEAGDSFVLDPAPWRGWAEANKTGDRGQRAWARAHKAQLAATGFDTAFCKTKRRPYDAVVCAILLRARYLAPEAIFIAGGGTWQHEWRYGADSLPGAHTPEQSARSGRGILEALFGQRQRKNPLGYRDDIAAAARRRR